MAESNGSWLDKPWRHHDLSNPALASLSLYAVEGAASLWHHNGDVDGIAAATAATAAAVAWIGDRHFWLQVYLTVATVVSLAWILYAEHFGPFTVDAFTGFAASAFVLGLLYRPLAFVDRRAKRREDERLTAKAEKDAERGDWAAVFASLGARGVEFVEELDFRAGRTIQMRLPTHGCQFTKVAALGERLETLLDLPHRSIKFRAGETARSFFVDIHTRDVLAEDLPFTFDLTRTTINEPFDIGVDVFGEDIEVLIREIRAAIFAPPGSGKSNLLNVLIARLLQCVDVVIWVIDFKHRLVKPWLEPWFEGRTQRPVLDWVATTPREARLMTQSLKKGIDHRSVTGTGSKIIPSAGQPTILLISDETASVTGLNAGPDAHALASNITDIINRGRSEAIDAILAFLRATVDMTGTSTFKALSKLRIVLGATSAADATSATDNPGMGSEVAAFEHPGTMLVQKNRNARIGKALCMEDEDVPVVAQAYSDRRPGLEADLVEALGDVYAKRWDLDRCGHLLPLERQRELGYKPAAVEPAAMPDTLVHRAIKEAADLVDRANAASLPTIPPPPANAQPAYRTAQGDPIPRKLDDKTVEGMFADLSAQLSDLKPAVHAGKERLVGLIKASGDAGVAPSELHPILNAEGITCGRQAVQDWLSELVRDGVIMRRARGDYIPNPGRRQ